MYMYSYIYIYIYTHTHVIRQRPGAPPRGRAPGPQWPRRAPPGTSKVCCNTIDISIRTIMTIIIIMIIKIMIILNNDE